VRVDGNGLIALLKSQFRCFALQNVVHKFLEKKTALSD